MEFFNNSCGLRHINLDSDYSQEAWFACHLNEAHLAFFICFVEFNLYESVYVI